MTTRPKWPLHARAYRFNALYGHVAILRGYAGVKLPYAAPGEIQHGWTTDAGISGDLTKHGEAERAFKYYVWNRRNLENCVDSGYRNATAIGAPFIYSPVPLSPDPPPIGDKSLLLFPFHTWEGEPFESPVHTYRRYLQEIRGLLPAFHPITVCLYWLQYEDREIINVFENHGMQVVTLGHRDNNPSFLNKFQDLAARHAYVSSNSYSTAIFYALYMRKKVFVAGKTPYSDLRRIIPLRGPSNYDLCSRAYPQLLWENFEDTSHHWIGEKELGLEFKRSPIELRQLFGWNPTNFASQLPHRTLVEAFQLSRRCWRTTPLPHTLLRARIALALLRNTLPKQK